MLDTEIQDLEALAPLFSFRLTEAAIHLGVSASILKKMCRTLGIKRWPHRTLKALKSYHRHGMPTSVYERTLNQFYENPNLSLDRLLPKTNRDFKDKTKYDVSSLNLSEQNLDIGQSNEINAISTLLVFLHAKKTFSSTTPFDSSSAEPVFTPLASKCIYKSTEPTLSTPPDNETTSTAEILTNLKELITASNKTMKN